MDNVMTTITMFRARNNSWQKPLVRMDVDHVSIRSVWLRDGGARIARTSEGTRICRQFASAKQWLLDELTHEISGHKAAIAALRSRLATIEAITEQDLPQDDGRY